MLLLWIVSIIATYIIAESKKLERIIWFLASIFLGPVAVIIILFVPGNKEKEPTRYDSDSSLPSIREELEGIKFGFNRLISRIENLEVKINALSPQEARQEAPSDLSRKESPVAIEEFVSAKKTDMEIDVGRFWLNRIGIIIFTLGIGFLISYTFRYFGAAAKVIFGYLISAALFFFGMKFEKKDRFVNYGRVLLGGAWAITYFTTYAMYHFDASRIIDNQLFDLVLLGFVAAGMIMHSLKYKSEELSGIALFLGYLTATLGDINYFTFFTCLFLAVATLVLVYKMQWIKIIFAGIIFTYFSHLFWVIRHIQFSRVAVGYFNVKEVYFLLNIGFLAIYWLIFNAGIHLIKSFKEESAGNKLSAANYCNLLLFFFMAYPKIMNMYPSYKFNFVLGLGGIYLVLAFIMEKLKSDKLSISDTLIAVSLLTLAVPLKFMPFHTSVVWLIELPFLIFIGLNFDRKVYRFFAFALALFLFFKVTGTDLSRGGLIRIWEYEVGWDKFISFLGFISMATCFYLGKHSKLRRALQLSSLEETLYNLFSALAIIYLTINIWLVVNLGWLTFSLSLETLLLFICGFLLVDKYLRIYSFIILLMVAFRFCFIDNYYLTNTFMRWFILSTQLLMLYPIYFLYRGLRKKALLGETEKILVNIVFIATTFLFTYAMYRYISHQWTSLALGLEGIVLFGVGFLGKDKVFRLGGFIIFALTLLKVLFIDLSGLQIIYKIISFIILGILFLGVSYVYTKYNIGKTQD